MSTLAEQAGRALLAARPARGHRRILHRRRVASALTDVPGSSQWFERGYVTYSNEAKVQDLGVDAAGTSERHGAVSAAVVEQMAAGALRASGADVAVAVSGVAGPDGGTLREAGGPGVPRGGGVGAARVRVSRRSSFSGDRAAVRRAAVAAGAAAARRRRAGRTGGVLAPKRKSGASGRFTARLRPLDMG